MAYQTGPSKPVDSIEIGDAIAFPIWEWSLDEEGVDEQDETWQRPIISTRNVTRDIDRPIITLRVEGMEYYASGEYEDATNTISAVSVWIGGKWQEVRGLKLQGPLVFISIPAINGEENVAFVMNDPLSDIARRVGQAVVKSKWWQFWRNRC